LVSPGQPLQRFRTLLALVASDPFRREELAREFKDWMDPRFTRRAEPKVFQRPLPILQDKGAPKMCYTLSWTTTWTIANCRSTRR
jgi:hypothetical protein